MIYLDHAAATPTDPRVLEAMTPYFTEEFFNPSAAYLPAKKVAADYEAAKAAIAHAIGAKSHDLVMTAGATEANNLALSAVNTTRSGDRNASFEGPKTWASAPWDADELRSNAPERPEKEAFGQDPTVRVLYFSTEHDSVRRVAEALGGKPVKVLRSGLIDMTDLRAKITDDTMLISIALVNGEIGVIQPLAEVASLIREIRFDRLRRGVKAPLLLHSDASQALSLLDINVARLGVDLMTLNSAKVCGPKGVGALYVSHEARLEPQILGGGQENGLRSGTENVPGAIGFAKAVELAKSHLVSNRKKYAEMREYLIANLEACTPIIKKHQLDNFLNICYDGLDGERLVYLLEEKEIYVATGAACAASKGEKSHVLRALGLSDSEIAGSLRLTLGATNTKEQIIAATKIINDVVTKERRRLYD